MDSWRAHLKRHSIPIEREVPWPEGGVSVYFRDPAGKVSNSRRPLYGAAWAGTSSRSLSRNSFTGGAAGNR